MGVLGLRRNAWESASAPQRQFLRAVLDKLELGQPATYEAPGGVQWLIFDDTRITPKFVETFVWAVVDVIAAITTAPVRDYPTTEIVQVEVPIYVEEERVDPETGETYTVLVDSGQTQLVDQEQPLGDPLTLAAAAQNAPAWINAAGQIPDGWTPVDTGV